MKVKTEQTAIFFSESDRTLYKFLMACQSFETARIFLKAIQKVAGDNEIPFNIDISEDDIQNVKSVIHKMQLWGNQIADQITPGLNNIDLGL